MGKPLLTDEMIERANRGEDISGPPLWSMLKRRRLSGQDHRGFGYERPMT